MQHKADFSIASSEVIATALGETLDQIQLSRNISQEELAAEAGVSRSTIARLGVPGKGISLDSFIRILQALKLADRLQTLLPDPSVRPLERVRFSGSERQRASHKRKRAQPWTWGDEHDDS